MSFLVVNSVGIISVYPTGQRRSDFYRYEVSYGCMDNFYTSHGSHDDGTNDEPPGHVQRYL